MKASRLLTRLVAGLLSAQGLTAWAAPVAVQGEAAAGLSMPAPAQGQTLAPAPHAALHEERRRQQPAAASAPAIDLPALLRGARHPDLLPDRAYAPVHALLHGDRGSARDAFADALAAYLTTPDFVCRQPLLARYFATRYASSPAAPGAASMPAPAAMPSWAVATADTESAPSAPAIAAPGPACDTAVPFRVLARYGEPETLWLDPARVRSIHLLFAGRNKALASRFGHVSLRLIVCPEGRTDTEACDSNLDEHIVLGFRAHIDELSLDVVRAFTGGYSAHFYANRFLDVYHEYAIDEFREMDSLPLRLSDARRAQMVRELAELHARFDGRYRYVSANCATLLQQSLRVLWPELADDRGMDWLRLRPDTLFAALRGSPQAEGELLADQARAEREGHYFPSTRPYYEKAAAVVRAAMTAPDFKSLEDFLVLAPAVRAATRAADAPYQARLAADSSLREAQILLEEFAMLRSERRLMAEAANYFLRNDVITFAGEARQRLPEAQRRYFDDCLFLPLQQRAKPVLFPGGLPRREELPAPDGAADTCRSPEAVAVLRGVLDTFLARDPPGRARLLALVDYHAGSITNLEALLAAPPASGGA